MTAPRNQRRGAGHKLNGTDRRPRAEWAAQTTKRYSLATKRRVRSHEFGETDRRLPKPHLGNGIILISAHQVIQIRIGWVDVEVDRRPTRLNQDGLALPLRGCRPAESEQRGAREKAGEKAFLVHAKINFMSPWQHQNRRRLALLTEKAGSV